MKIRDNRPDSFAVVEINGGELRVSKDDLAELDRLTREVARGVLGDYGCSDPGWCVRSRKESEKKTNYAVSGFMAVPKKDGTL